MKKRKFFRAGEILKCQGSRDTLWYVSPLDGKRRLITLSNAPLFFKKIIATVGVDDLEKIPDANQIESNKHIVFRKKLKGKFILQEGAVLPRWYVDNTLKKVEITCFDFFDLLNFYAVKISKEDLELIPQ
jgi:hypothetical protein